jgi:hypothetical protein
MLTVITYPSALTSIGQLGIGTPSSVGHAATSQQPFLASSNPATSRICSVPPLRHEVAVPDALAVHVELVGAFAAVDLNTVVAVPADGNHLRLPNAGAVMSVP